MPVEYFHVVFTVPQLVAPLALRNQRVVYGILFHAAAETLLQIAADPKHLGARVGFLVVLHTGDKTFIIRTSTASFLAAGSRQTSATGFRIAGSFSFRSRCSAVCSAPNSLHF